MKIFASLDCLLLCKFVFEFVHVCTYILQIDTKDILFIVGGAFVDLDKTISER